jgi:drug/metabolite transporter (DMT)-like permease
VPSRAVLAAAIALLIAIWGTTWAAIRIGLDDLPPLTSLAARFAISGLVLLALMPAFGVRLRPDRRVLGLWLANGTLTFGLSYGIVYWGEQRVPSGLTALLFATFPLFVSVLGHFFLPGERMHPRGVAGTLVGFAGVVVIFSEDLSRLGGPGVSTAAAVLLGAPALSSVANVAVKRYGRGVHPLSLTAVPLLGAAAAIGVVAVFAEADRTVRWTPAAIGSVVYLALFGSALAFVVYFWLLDKLPATRLSLITYAVPVVAVAVGTLVLDERLTARIVAGAALVIAGVALAGRARPAGTPSPESAASRPPHTRP